MEENQNNIGFVEKLALIADACENLIPARANILFQLNEGDYNKVCEIGFFLNFLINIIKKLTICCKKTTDS
jgi:hypothetical protein